MKKPEEIIIKRSFIVRHFWPSYLSTIFLTLILSAILSNLFDWINSFFIIIILFIVIIIFISLYRFFYFKWNKKSINLMFSNEPKMAYQYYFELLSKPAFLPRVIFFILYSNMNLAYFYSGYYEEALQEQKKIRLPRGKFLRLSYFNNLALFYFINNDINSARIALDNMKKLCTKNKRGISLFERMTHIINISSEEVNISYTYLKKECKKQEKRILIIISNHFLLAKCCIELSFKEEALENLNKIISIGGENVFVYLANKLIEKINNVN